jgi:predicted nucleic acid-binding Zn ribbon protein
MEVVPSVCHFCGAAVAPDALFCSSCGEQLKEKPLSTSLLAQLGIYAVSILLPPFGLWPGIKYFKHSDPKVQQIGIVAIVLTVISTIVTIWAIFAFLNIYLNTLNESLNGLGY